MRRPWIAGVAATLAAVLVLLPLGEGLGQPLFDAWQRQRPRDMADTRVHVVGIDAASIAAIGPWPWPRYHLARLTEEIGARGAMAIGFDILFSEPDRVRPDIFARLYPELSPAAASEIRGLTPMDALFGEAIGNAPVVLARAGLDSGGAEPKDLAIEAAFPNPVPDAFAEYRQVIASIPELDGVAAGTGLINGRPDDDGIVRQVPLVARLGGRPSPGFALELVRVALGEQEIATAPRSVTVANRRVPVGEDGRMRLRFGEFPTNATSSAVDLLRQGSATDLRGKIVIVGLVAEGTADIVATPLGTEGFGVFVHAQATDAILRGGGWIDRPAWAGAAEWLIGLVYAVLAILVLTRGGRLWLAVPVVGSGIAAVSWGAFDIWSQIFDPVRPIAMGIAASSGVALAIFAQTRAQKISLSETLVRERVTAAANDAELQAARAIQRGMLPDARQLTALDPRVDLHALIEPARTVGGDFFDAARLDADRIAFFIGDVTGKGVPAALFMALAKALTKSVVLRTRDVANVPAALNRELSRDNAEAMGVTMLIGVIDLRDGSVEIINAGHENPIRLDGHGARDVPMVGGPPFCIVDFDWPVETLTLRPGEAILLVTDGVTEARTASGALYGRARLLDGLRAAPLETSRTITDASRRSVRAFEDGAEAADDLTVMAIRFVG